MPVVTASRASGALAREGSGGWWLRRWAAPQVVAGISDRGLDAAGLLQRLPFPVTVVSAEQVHGGSVAAVQRALRVPVELSGCDGLLTNVPGVALLIRTADCLPLFIADPSKGLVGLAHVGWRGLAARLPMRLLAMLRHAYQSRPDDLRVAIGPSIRACCYEIGEEFVDRFGPFVQFRGARRTCDLVGVAIQQLRESGVRPHRILDTQRCTACDPRHWFSVRREGASAGRMTSLIVLRPLQHSALSTQPTATSVSALKASGGATGS